MATAAMPSFNKCFISKPHWVVLPHRSTPSKTINAPRAVAAAVEGAETEGGFTIMVKRRAIEGGRGGSTKKKMPSSSWYFYFLFFRQCLLAFTWFPN
jgi:hypothetical protein